MSESPSETIRRFIPTNGGALDHPEIWRWGGIEPSIYIQTGRRLIAFGEPKHLPHLEHVNVHQIIFDGWRT